MAIINGVGRVGIRNYVSPTNPLWDNLTHYYSADNNANDSKGTAHGTLMNGTAYSSAKINNGFNMDGVNDFVQLPDDTFKFLGDFSISFWIYKKSNNTPLYLAALKAGDVWYGGFYMYNSGGGIATVINGWDVTTSSIIPSNQWTHVVFTHKQSTINRFYVNGVLNNTSSGVRNSTVNPDHSTGVILSTIGYAWSPDAIMDEVATFNTELTASQVSELYNSGAGKQYIATTPTYTARTTSFAAATGITDTTILNALNTFDTGLISNGLDTKMKALYPFVGGTATTHKFNFMDARDLDVAFRLQFNGGWTHLSTGALSNGTNGYADTFLNGNSVLVANNTHVSIYVNNNLTALTAAPGFGSFFDSTNGSFYTHLRISNNYYSFIGSENGSSSYGNTYANTDTSGYYISSRTSSTNMKAYKSNVLKNTTTLTNTATLPPVNFTFGGIRNSTNLITPATWNNYSHTFASLGNGLNDTDASNLYTLVQAFQTSLSRQV